MTKINEIENEIEIDWNDALAFTSNQQMSLREAELNVEHTINFAGVKKIEETGMILAEVSSETLEGDHLWLRGKFGAQNGLLSLIKAAGDGKNIMGNNFIFTRIESTTSPAGYAYYWQAE